MDRGRLIGFAKITRDVYRARSGGHASLEEARIGLVQSTRRRDAASRASRYLAHVARVTTMGELTASIAHEVNQPIAAAMLNAQAALRWLAAQPPDLDEAKQALTRLSRPPNERAMSSAVSEVSSKSRHTGRIRWTSMTQSGRSSSSRAPKRRRMAFRCGRNSPTACRSSKGTGSNSNRSC